MKKILLIWIALAGTISTPAHAIDGPANFNFDGVLLNPTTNIPTTGPVALKLQIFDPSGVCLLFEETHPTVAIDLDGGFVVKVGSGTRSSVGIDGGLAWKTVFSNKAQLRSSASANCSPGYTPATTDSRALRVTVNGTEVLTPDFSMSAVPFATVADSLQGYYPTDFVSTAGGSSVSGFIKMDSSNQLRFSDGTANYVALKAPASLAATTVWSLPGTDGSTGQVLATDGAGNLSWANASGGSSLPMSGGAMTGAITMGGNDILSTGNINMSAQTSLNLGNYTSSEESALIGGLSTAHKGKIWFNSTANSLSFWDGSAVRNASPLTSVAGRTGTVVLDASDITSATTKYFTYKPNNIACANSDVLQWDSTNLRWICGTGGGGGITALTGDVTASGTGSVATTIASGAITTAKLANDSVQSAKINSAGIAINRLLITDASTGTTTGYATCSTYGEVLKWQATGWQCGASGSIASITGGTGLVGGVITSSGSFSVDVGTTANKILQLNGSAQLPAVDGSLLTNVNAMKIGFRSVSSVTPSSGHKLIWNATSSAWEPGYGFEFGNNGNSFGTNALLGTNDAFALIFMTSSAARLTITNSGNVGIGTTSPQVSLDMSAKQDAIRVPVGGDGVRPASPGNGDIRFSNTINNYEFYRMGGWEPLNKPATHGMQVFNIGGTFVVPIGVYAVKVTIIGAAGGGFTSSTGGNGGAGVVHLAGLTPGNGISVTVGTGGATSASPSNGTSSTFGSYVNATGGMGAASGTGTNGNIGVSPSGGVADAGWVAQPGLGSLYGKGLGLMNQAGGNGIVVVEY